jgi:RNA polymerase sigma-70 factor (ECF subfamily)
MNTAGDTDDHAAGPPPASATSRTLVARVQANEPAAWERLVGLYAPLVVAWCRRAGLKDQDAADVFQDVFQAVVAYVGRFRRDRESDTFRGWLRRIVQNKVRDHFRRLGREAQGVGGSSAGDRLARLPEPPDAPDELAPEDAERGLFAQALGLIRGEFEERTWAAFWQTAVEGRPPKEVAADLAMSPGAVRVAKSRVLRRLREELGDLPD